MSHFQFQTVPNIISGLGSIQELQNVLSSKAYRKLLLVRCWHDQKSITSTHSSNFRYAQY
jgi:hypothetical protein